MNEEMMINAQNTQVCGIGVDCAPKEIDHAAWRRRKIELFNIALQLLEIAEGMGVKHHEFCEVGKYIDQLK